jgi:hypothetical protein
MRRLLLRGLDSRVFEILIYLTIFLLNLRLCFVLSLKHTDFAGHAELARKIFSENAVAPHPLLHYLVHGGALLTRMPHESILSLLAATLSVIDVVICKALVKYYQPGIEHNGVTLLAAVAANHFAAIFIPSYNPLPYLGQWSPNIWHSPTMALLKPLAIMGFWGTMICLAPPQPGRRWIPWLTSLTLLAGTLAKPSFSICFIPAIVLFLLVFHLREFRMSKCALLLFLPSACLLASQFLHTYSHLAQPTTPYQDSIVLSFFGATRAYAPSAFVSSLLVLAFPLSVLLAIRRRVLQNRPLLVSYVLGLVGFFQGSFLAEENKLRHANFVFGYIISLFMLYLFSLIEYLSWMRPEGKAKVATPWKIAVSLIMLAHLVSGLLYWRSLVLGQINL